LTLSPVQSAFPSSSSNALLFLSWWRWRRRRLWQRIPQHLLHRTETIVLKVERSLGTFQFSIFSELRQLRPTAKTASRRRFLSAHFLATASNPNLREAPLSRVHSLSAHDVTRLSPRPHLAPFDRRVPTPTPPVHTLRRRRCETEKTKKTKKLREPTLSYFFWQISNHGCVSLAGGGGGRVPGRVWSFSPYVAVTAPVDEPQYGPT
jgi:hypothetical protein